MHETPRAGGVFLGAALLLTLPSAADVAAEFSPAVANFSGGLVAGDRYRPAQTFTAAESGWLSAVWVPFTLNGIVPPAGLELRLHTVTGLGAPGAIVARSVGFAPDLPNRPQNPGVVPGMVRADSWAGETELKAGVSYALSVDLAAGGVEWYGTYIGPGPVGPGGELPASMAYAGGLAYDTFDSGLTWNARPQYDFGFVVEAVPEPGAVALVLLGGGLLAANASRRPKGSVLVIG